MEQLFTIPIVGVVLQLVAYIIDTLVTGGVGPTILSLAAPVALGALCGIMNERSGIVNIGIEGMMLTGAFAGFVTALVVNQMMPAEPGAVFGATPALVMGLVAAIIAGMLVSCLHAWLSISVGADQIISGTIINIIAVGLTGYLHSLMGSPGAAGTFQSFSPPEALTSLPLVGWIFNMFLSVGPITMSVIVFVIGLQIWLFRTRWGLRTRAVGEHPRAADTVGINVTRLRYRNVILGGIFAGLAGGWLTLEATSSFQPNMTAGRGFIALACVIFGRWHPVGAFLGALLFMGSQAIGLQIQIDPPSGDLGAWLTAIQADYPSMYNNFYVGLPYLLTLIVLAGVVGRSIPPAAVGQPYRKEGAH